MATRWVWAVGLLAACSQAGTASVAEDAVADVADVGAADVVVDAYADIAGLADVALDVQDVAKTDAQDVADVPQAETSPDVAADVAETTNCDELLAQMDALKPALTPCTLENGCSTFEFPICNSFGCYQTPVGAGSDTTALSALAQKAMTAQCPGFHCGCGVSTPSFCLKSQCRQCPPDCDGTCDEVKTALLSTAHAVSRDWASDAPPQTYQPRNVAAAVRCTAGA